MNYLILGKQVFGNNLSGTEFTEKLVISSDKDFSDEELIRAFERHLVYEYVEEGWEEEEIEDDDFPYEDYEPSDYEMMSNFGTKWHDKL